MRHALLAAVLTFGALLLSLAAGAADYPAKPVRFVASAPAGSDVLVRLLAEALEARWKQSVVVDNRPGAGGLISHEFVAKAEPDGSPSRGTRS
jgi:tripartite-type tricarboxylate transporter receptor subunit TctC